MILIDVSNYELYQQGHIPKSINSPLSHWRENRGDFSLVKNQTAIQKEFQKLGINKNSKVVVYLHHSNTKDIIKASYIIWAMKYYGFKNTAMLNGGIIAWRELKGDINYNKTTASKKRNLSGKKKHSFNSRLSTS